MDRKLRRRVTVTVIVAAVLAAVVLGGGQLFYRLYPWDRIKGTVSLTVDGERVSLAAEDIVFISAGQGSSNADGSAEVRLKAGNYGGHTFEINSAALDGPITVTCFQPNWWNVMRFELDVNVDGGVTYSGKYSSVSERGFPIYDTIDHHQGFGEKPKLTFGL